MKTSLRLGLLLAAAVAALVGWGLSAYPDGTRLLASSQEPLPNSILYVPGSTQKVCQLTGEMDHETHQPTASETASRFGLVAADLGYSFEHKGKLFFLFGDSMPTPKFRGKPNGRYDPPRIGDDNDAIAFASPTNASRIRLDFVTDAIGAFKNPVVLDAEGRPAVTLATNEAPGSGVSVAGRMYVIFMTDNPIRDAKPPEPLGFSTRSVIGVSDDDGRTFHYLYDFSKGPDAKFVNVAIAHGPEGHLYFWGTQGGALYRKSAVFFARKKAADMDRAGGMDYFAGFDEAGKPRFSASEADAVPLFAESMEPRHATGELGVEWNRFVKRWVMLYNCQNRGPANPPGIWMRLAVHAWGPWSAPQTVFDARRDGGYGRFVHRAVTPQDPVDDGLAPPAVKQHWGGAYAPYFISRFTTGDEARARSTFYYTLSTWIPYGQVVMKTTIEAQQ